MIRGGRGKGSDAAEMLKVADRGDEALATKLSILGALRLYLDFINIFLYVLRILGRKR